MKKILLKNLFFIFIFAIFATFSSAYSNEIQPINNHKATITNIKTYDCHFDNVKTSQSYLKNQQESIKTKSNINNNVTYLASYTNTDYFLYINQNIVIKSQDKQQYFHNILVSTNNPRAP